MNEEMRCESCNNKLRNIAKGKYCAKCRSRNKWKELYEDLKRETDKRFMFYDRMIKEYYNRLKKYENLKWENEND